MKKLIQFVLLFLYTSIGVFSQWQPAVRLTNDTTNSITAQNNTKFVSANGDTLHVTWSDLRDGNYQIYYKRSFDGGVSWGSDTRLTNNSFHSYDPTIATYGTSVHIVWTDTRNGNQQIGYKRSTDGGDSWSADTMLTNLLARAGGPSISIIGSEIHVVWFDHRYAHHAVYYMRSIDNGLNWDQEINISGNNFTACYSPSVSASGPFVHVVWQDWGDGMELYYTRSLSKGAYWEDVIRLTADTGYSDLPCVISSGLYVHVVWSENRNDPYSIEIYYKRSTDAGATWEPDYLLADTYYNAIAPSVTCNGPNVHLVWNEVLASISEIYHKFSTDHGVSWGVDNRLTKPLLDAWSPSIAISGEKLHVVWSDKSAGNNEIYYLHNPNGNAIGIQNIGTEVPGKYSLFQNYPNPFNPATKIIIAVPDPGLVTLKLFDILGQETAILLNKHLSSGTYEINWDGSDFAGGVYFYKMQAGEFTATRKMILLK